MTHTFTHATSRSIEVSELIGFNLELGFQLAPEPAASQRKRMGLVFEAFEEIAARDERLKSWFLLPLHSDGWVYIRATICTDQPGEAVALSEDWMQSAIAAANAADERAATAVPHQRDQPALHPSVLSDSPTPLSFR